jgi:hypothetical protein
MIVHGFVDRETRDIDLFTEVDDRFDRPDYADITVGGHYEAGEQIEDGVREVHEELGLIDLTYADLHPIGLHQTAVTLGPDYLEREFQHWHPLPLDTDLEAIPLADVPIQGYRSVTLANLRIYADHAAAGATSSQVRPHP